MAQDATWRAERQSDGNTLPSPAKSARRRGCAISTAGTHQGLRRTNNQDAFLERPDIALWAVADGVGGLAAGEKASGAVIDALAAIRGCDKIAERVVASLQRANYDLRLEALIGEQGMAATTAVVFTADKAQRKFTCLWVGDSRLYRLRAGMLEQVTRDHTPQARFSDSGHSGLQKASPANALSRAIGSDENLDVEQVKGVIKPGDLFLLCTDGLSKPVGTGHISRLLATGEIASAPERLIDAALDAGGPDNVTAVVVAFPGKSRFGGKRGDNACATRDTGSPRWLSKYIFLFIGMAALALSISPGAWQSQADFPETFHSLVAANLALLTLVIFGETVSRIRLRRIARWLVAIIGAAVALFTILQWSSAPALPGLVSIQDLFAF